MQILTSWDDGTIEDKRIVNLLKKYDLPGVFYIPINSWGFENIGVYKDFEIGGHTIVHDNDMSRKSNFYQRNEIIGCKLLLENKLQKPVTKFCYPRGRYLDITKEIVEEAGFKSARTTKIGVGGDKFEQKGFHCYQRTEYDQIEWLEYIKNKYEIYKNEDTIFEIWGHSAEISRNDGWNNLEELFKFLKKT